MWGFDQEEDQFQSITQLWDLHDDEVQTPDLLLDGPREEPTELIPVKTPTPHPKGILEDLDLGEPLFDLTTSVERPNSSVAEKSEKIQTSKRTVPVEHLLGGMTILVTEQRKNRIMANRIKRERFLRANPRYTIPYKYRPDRKKHESRVKACHERKRYEDGKFVYAVQKSDLMAIVADAQERKTLSTSDMTEGC